MKKVDSTDSILNAIECFFIKDKDSFISAYNGLSEGDKFYTLLSCLNICDDALIVEKKSYFTELKSDLSFIREWNSSKDEQWSEVNNTSLKIMCLIPIEYGGTKVVE